MEPAEVIKRVVNMDIWENTVWVNHQQQLFFVPIWRCGNTEFMYAAEKFGYKLEVLTNDNYTGWAFIRNPDKRIMGQIWRAMENQKFSFEHCISCLETNNISADPHFRSQYSFLQDYNITYKIDLDNLANTNHSHIDLVVEHMKNIKKPKNFSENKLQIQNLLKDYSHIIKNVFAKDYEMYYNN